MKLKEVSPIIAMLLIVSVSGCKNDLANGASEMSIKSAAALSPVEKSAKLPSTSGSLAVVNLGSAGNFVILSESGITTTGTTAVTGDIGSSPIAATALTGFGLTMDATGTFSTSTLVAGKVYAADYKDPTPTMMTTAIGDMGTAYTDAAGRLNPKFLDLGAGEIGGLTLKPGLYKFTTPVTISTNVTISGSSNDVWIFQIPGTLTMSSAVRITLAGNAQAKNIFWQVAGAVTLGTTSHFEGIILGQTNIAMQTGASINGRMLAQTAVTLDANNVTLPYLGKTKK